MSKLALRTPLLADLTRGVPTNTGLARVLALLSALFFLLFACLLLAPSAHLRDLRFQGLSARPPEPNVLERALDPDPSHAQYKGRFHSQFGQDSLVYSLLGNQSNGFFVESGALDGVWDSNTLFMETVGWTGLLVEGNPLNFRKLRASRRTSWMAGVCLSDSGTRKRVVWRMGAGLGGIEAYIDEPMKDKMRLLKDSNHSWFVDEGGDGHLGEVDCWPLLDLLDSMPGSVPGMVHLIDYWSLDTEGSESAILKSTDFSRLDVRVMTVEVNTPEAERKVREVMGRLGFVFHSKVDQYDLLYVNKELAKRIVLH
ncbi:hypothetical protein DFJ74DRAFT_702840 [Hyaloraphidium curvatum]|nr:hypothetical protein DFJ74DRAFT_702840 [Hyaloraphidium curvatum]